MENTSQDDLYNFESLYMTQRELRNRKFDETRTVYNELAIEYRITHGDKK
jgi:sulfur relay (sulfurtransferase) DsrF/TusC family protein